MTGVKIIVTIKSCGDCPFITFLDPSIKAFCQEDGFGMLKSGKPAWKDVRTIDTSPIPATCPLRTKNRFTAGEIVEAFQQRA